MNISKASKATGLTAKTIRYYEAMNLVTPAHREDNGYRVYSEEDIRELSFISHGRELGFSLKECGELIGLYRDSGRKSADVKAIALKRLVDVENKIQQLERIKESLKQLTDCCHGDGMPECPILEGLIRQGSR